MRHGRKVVLAAYGQTEESLAVLVRIHGRYLESVRARKSLEDVNGGGDEGRHEAWDDEESVDGCTEAASTCAWAFDF